MGAFACEMQVKMPVALVRGAWFGDWMGATETAVARAARKKPTKPLLRNNAALAAIWKAIEGEAETGIALGKLAAKYKISRPVVYKQADEGRWAIPRKIEDEVMEITKRPLDDGTFPVPDDSSPLSVAIRKRLDGAPVSLVPLTEFKALMAVHLPTVLNSKSTVQGAWDGNQESTNHDLLMGSDSSVRIAIGARERAIANGSESASSLYSTNTLQNEHLATVDELTKTLISQVKKQLPPVRTVKDLETVLNMRAKLVGLADTGKGGSGPTVVNVQILNGMRRLSKGKPVRKARGKVVEVIETEETED